MPRRTYAWLAIALLATAGFAKDKNKNLLPAYVLAAHTVAVIIDPSAGISIDDPRANVVAQKDVETAILNWGRFEPMLSSETADLVIVIRKSNGRFMNETIPDARQNNRAGVINPTDNGVSAGGQRTPRSGPGDNSDVGAYPRGDGPQTELGETEDSFLVYRGGVDHPLDAPPAWRYRVRDGLSPHSVPAVAAFKKAIADAEKAAAKQP